MSGMQPVVRIATVKRCRYFFVFLAHSALDVLRGVQGTLHTGCFVSLTGALDIKA